VARAALERQRRELDLAVSGQVQEAIAGAERWRLAKQSAAAQRETSRLAQKAYAAGEADVQTLLLVRRQALEATSAAQAQVQMHCGPSPGCKSTPGIYGARRCLDRLVWTDST